MSKDCQDHCGEIASQRIRYFTGRYMTARDFRDEQEYHRSHRYLHNRILHGWGVVCGLHVLPHPKGACAVDHVRVGCGFALDCCGRELPVDRELVPQPIPWDQRPTAAAAAAPEARYYPLLCLEYAESEIERLPVLYNEQTCDAQRREASRYQEGYQFSWHWVRYTDLAQYHWKTRSGCVEPDPAEAREGRAPCPEDDCEGASSPGCCCLDPQCPPGQVVPLAFIRSEPGTKIEADEILLLGRPSLEPPKHALTHICHINWPHGGMIARRHVESHLRQLRIRFDRRLRHPHGRPGYCGPHGINPCTFVVQAGGGYEDLDFITYSEPPQLEHDCVAVFTIDPRANDYNHDLPYAYLENQTVFITLKCDFLPDCHGVAVDGNHLGGVLPSGDGVAGGTFESWFRVVPDHEYDRQREETNQPAQTEQAL